MYYKFNPKVLEFCPCPTWNGYSLTSVSTPPTILVILSAKPQLQLEVSEVVVMLLGDTVDDMDNTVDVFVKAK